MAAFVLYRSEFLATDPEVPEESEEDCDDLVAAVALKRKKTPSQYASILSHTLKAEIDIVKYAVINVDVSDNVPIQPVTSINIREKEIEDIVQRMPSDSQLAEKRFEETAPLSLRKQFFLRLTGQPAGLAHSLFCQSFVSWSVWPSSEYCRLFGPPREAVCFFAYTSRMMSASTSAAVEEEGCCVKIHHSCPAQFADIVRGLATTGARRVGTPTALARLFVCGTSRRQNADPWSPDAASTASPKAAISRITCVSQNRTATIIRTRTQYGSWRYGCSSARLRDFQTRGLGVRSSGSTVPYARGTRSSVWKTKYFPATYSPSLVQRSVDKKPTNAFRVSGSATKGRSNIDTMPPLTPSHAD
uniref:Uncharacterized protein n=1 Tax=Timema monikensis TaxID=170555 RepID=A0A7R9HHU5_9NEOP|nr:unnamed protein product [Timema monikensis]